MDRSSGRLLLDYRASEPVLVESERSSLSDAPLSRSQIQRPCKPSAAPWNPAHDASLRSQLRPLRRKLKLPGRSRSKHVAKLPRMDEVISRVEITETQQAAMRDQAEELIAGCLLKSKAAWNGTKHIFDDPKQWKLHSAKPHLAVYKRRDPHRRSATTHQFVASGRIPGLTLQDVEYGKYSDTTLDERSISAYLFRDYFLDAAVLQVLETQTEDDPFRFFGIKWIAFASPSGPARFFSPRDHAYYEYAKTVTTEDGTKVLVKVMQSVGNDILPPLTQIVSHDKPSDGVDPSKLRFVRGHLSIITTYAFDSKANAVKVFSEGALDPGGRASAWLGSAFLSQFAPTVARIEYCADIKYIMKHGMVFPHPPVALSHSQSGQSLGQSQSTMSGSEVTAHGPAALPLSGFPPTFEMGRMSISPQPSWVPDHQRKVCFVCFKSFGVVRRHRHHCRMCGEVMCSRCMITLPLVAPPSSAPCPDEDYDGEVENNESDAIRPRRSHRTGTQLEGRPLSVLLRQPAKKSLEETRPNGYPAVNNVKLCKKCMFNIRQERKGTMRGATNFYAAPTMIKQFPLVLQGSLADNIGLQPGPMRGFFPGGRYAADDELINNAERGEEDDIEETDEAYSARVERMRQMHMAREKKKNLRRSILLYDEDDLNNGGESPPARPSHLFHGGNTSFNFDDLLLPMPKRDEDGEDTNRLSNRARGVSSTNQSDAIPPPAPRRPSTTARQSEGSSKLRSLSIPDQLEQVERSIAQQEALIRTITEQRSKMIRSPEDDTVARTTAATTAGEMSSEARSSLLYPGSTQTAPTPRADALFTPLSMRSS
ncbi:hypothetical protein PF006_g13590 [Phytophthora fragariae]|nr:hypothetical protein PF003_g3328 [Phytophthora fragariae]KAE9003160.1 hypothetical protein PF011_g13007 [Phytophthora fragariae]KAE9140141.1 hypothetical protein PF006_g13590 [Phytophthora fragariae]KAE9219364.1 hypothetical protein PF004_g13624 [Phytophthora fragariae]